MKKDLTLDMVMRVVKLSKLQIRNLFSAVMKKTAPAPDAPLAEDAVFYILIADMMENLAFLSAEQRLLLLELMWASRHMEDWPETADNHPCCAQQIAFADGRFATWSGQFGWTDLESGERVTTLPRTPLETIAYNLVELRHRGVRLIENRAGLNVKNNAGSVEEPGDVCDSTTDAVS